MQSINKINSTSIQVKSRSGNVLQLFLFAEKRLEFSLVRTRYKKQKFPPHFFARIPGKKITKPQGFTSRFCVNKSSSLKTEGFLHIFTKLRKPCLLRRSFHSPVKTFHSANAPFHLLATAQQSKDGGCFRQRRKDVFLLTAHLTVLKYIQLYYTAKSA